MNGHVLSSRLLWFWYSDVYHDFHALNRSDARMYMVGHWPISASQCAMVVFPWPGEPTRATTFPSASLVAARLTDATWSVVASAKGLLARGGKWVDTGSDGLKSGRQSGAVAFAASRRSRDDWISRHADSDGGTGEAGRGGPELVASAGIALERRSSSIPGSASRSA